MILQRMKKNLFSKAIQHLTLNKLLYLIVSISVCVFAHTYATMWHEEVLVDMNKHEKLDSKY